MGMLSTTEKLLLDIKGIIFMPANTRDGSIGANKSIPEQRQEVAPKFLVQLWSC